MLKNNKAVTLVLLVVTVIVILILGGTTITTSDVLIKDTKRKQIVANMLVVKGQLEAVYDEYQFSEDPADLVGTATTNLTLYGITPTADDLWYIWRKSDLTALGMDPDMLPSNLIYYIVNYTTGEVIYSQGAKNDEGRLVYTLTDMLE